MDAAAPQSDESDVANDQSDVADESDDQSDVAVEYAGGTVSDSRYLFFLNLPHNRLFLHWGIDQLQKLSFGCHMRKSLSLLVTAIAIVFFVQSMFQSDNSVPIEQALAETSEKLNATLPMEIDEETRLDATKAGPGNQLTYLYTLINVSSADLEPANFVAAMRPQLVNGYRTSPGMAVFRKNRVELHYHYRDRDGDTVAIIVVSPQDF